GQTSSTDVIGALRRDTTTWNKLMSADATEAGVRYQRNPNSAATHHWGVSALTSADVPTGNTAFFADPAGQALVAAIEGALGPVAASALHSGADGGSGGGGSGGGDWAEPWAATTYYGIGATVQGKRPGGGRDCLAKMTGRYGRSGETEPIWPSAGGAIGDFEISWTVLSDIPEETAATIDDYYASLIL
ncbi:MAG: hypothetical protein KDJ28_03680, partial [Candidatus Competibacteraceae bacterium]|nr:hypothetical protein [Candidatus Competibacteraceae bacterium]